MYFSTRNLEGYGKLSGQNIDDLESGARIAVGEVKRILWTSRCGRPERPRTRSPGSLRGAWAVRAGTSECSAMSKSIWGDTIDIHAGGQDLQFPHHENEIAQSECCNGVPFAHYWMHNGYITIDNEKMSKSKGNFFTVRDILKDYKGEVMRFFLLSGHYRSPINFSDTLMEQAKNGLARMENCKENLSYLAGAGADGDMTAAEQEALAGYEKYREAFKQAMDDDLNTADAISAVFELITAANTAVKDGGDEGFRQGFSGDSDGIR